MYAAIAMMSSSVSPRPASSSIPRRRRSPVVLEHDRAAARCRSDDGRRAAGCCRCPPACPRDRSAGDRLADPPVFDQRLALLDAPDRDVGGESGFRIAPGHPATDPAGNVMMRLPSGSVPRLQATEAHAPAADERLRHGRRFVDLGERRRLERGEILAACWISSFGHRPWQSCSCGRLRHECRS